MRAEFSKLLNKYGEEIVYYKLTKFPCNACQGKEPDVNSCTNCLASGRELEKKNLLTRSEAQSVPQSWPRMIDKKPIGDWQQPIYLFYFEHDKHLNEKDMIIKDDRIYKIEFVDPLKGMGDRIEYYRAGAQHKPTIQELI